MRRAARARLYWQAAPVLLARVSRASPAPPRTLSRHRRASRGRSARAVPRVLPPRGVPRIAARSRVRHVLTRDVRARPSCFWGGNVPRDPVDQWMFPDEEEAVPDGGLHGEQPERSDRGGGGEGSPAAPAETPADGSEGGEGDEGGDTESERETPAAPGPSEENAPADPPDRAPAGRRAGRGGSAEVA